MFPLFKKGDTHFVYPILRGGGPQKVPDPRFFDFVAPLSVINDQSLTLRHFRLALNTPAVSSNSVIYAWSRG